MMRSLIAIAALVFLASCAETPSKPTTSGGSSSGSGKIVTATPEESLECDGDLILEPHLPEECIPPEPPEPVVQRSVEPPRPNPIIGTYKTFSRYGLTTIWRLTPDGSVTEDGRKIYTWKPEEGIYRLYSPTEDGGEVLWLCLTLQNLKGEPDLIMSRADGCKNRYWLEAIKVSDDPEYSFDFYTINCYHTRDKCFPNRTKKTGPLPAGINPGWHCRNVGRAVHGSKRFASLWNGEPYEGLPSAYADSLEECEANCEAALINRFGEVGEGNCSDYQG